MSSENTDTFSTGSNVTCRCRGHLNDPPLRCYCGYELRIHTSWTKSNPGRRFISCPERGVNKCGFFKWIDDDNCDRSRNIISGLLDKLKLARTELASTRQHVQFLKKMVMISWIITFVVCFVACADFIYDDEWKEREDRLFIQVLIEQQAQNNFAPNRVNAHAVLIAMDTVNKEFNHNFSYDYCHERLEMLEKWYRTFYWVIRKHGSNQFGIAYHETGDPCWMELCQLFGTLFNPANDDVINISSGTETDDIGNLSGLPDPPRGSAEIVNISSSPRQHADESFSRYLSRFAGGNDIGSESSVNQPTPSNSNSGTFNGVIPGQVLLGCHINVNHVRRDHAPSSQRARY
ncbi:hypothetical protein DH2020_014908 [Rehmannia glutinosa]|uniref:GRF-type domain-containing protein n=1 Tax=Rehmannia glutinosa TaxID=99300 RepID=A0ABR0WXT1_REHGL